MNDRVGAVLGVRLLIGACFFCDATNEQLVCILVLSRNPAVSCLT